MLKIEPLKYRIISERHTTGFGGFAGTRILTLCLNIGLHAIIELDEFTELKDVTKLTPALSRGIRFTTCDCSDHPEVAPVWLAEALVQHHQDASHQQHRTRKTKKRPAMGTKR